MKTKNFKYLLLLLFYFQLSTMIHAQTPLPKQWDKRFGGNNSSPGFASMPSKYPFKIVNTGGGGYLVGSQVYLDSSGDKSQLSWGGYDYWVVKTDLSGNKLWDKRYGGDGLDFLFSIVPTKGGEYLLGGSSSSGISGDKTQPHWGVGEDPYDYWIVKIDSNGNKLWDKRYGGNESEILASMLPTSDGGYLLGGTSGSGISGDRTQPNWGVGIGEESTDYWIVKIDANGNKLWDKRFGGTNLDYLFSIESTGDGGFLLSGTSLSGNTGDKTEGTQGRYDYWVVKIDFAGNKLWDKRYGGSEIDFLYSVKATPDKGFLLAGSTDSGISGDKTQLSQGLRDYWVIKIDSAGNTLWDKRYGGSGFDNLSSIEAAPTGGYILAGGSRSDVSGDKTVPNCLGSFDEWILKIDDNGNKLWDERFGGDSTDFCASLLITKDGGILLGGYSNSNISCDKSQPAYAYTNSNGGLANTYDYWIVKLGKCSKATISPSGTASLCSGSSSLTLTANSGLGITYQWLRNGQPLINETGSTLAVKKKGKYKVIESTAAGCKDTSAATTINLLPAPDVVITPQGNLDICASGSVTLKANSGTGLTYQWKKGANNIAGATNVQYTATKKGTYRVVITSSNGCSTTSKGVIVSNSCKSLINKETSSITLEQNKKIKAIIYPNPVHSILNINLNSSPSLKAEMQMRIFNADGKVVISQKAAQSNMQADVKQLTPGIYFIRIEHTNGQIVFKGKFIKE